MEEFPEIPPENIVMGSRKDKLNVDILLDDGMHNVFNSSAAYPILLRRPWNQSATGMLAVNNYDEFLKTVEVITKSYAKVDGERIAPKIVVLVGPSGSGKNKVADLLLEKCAAFEKLVSYTTRVLEAHEAHYTYVPKKEFLRMMDEGVFFESTMYAGEGFGSRREDVDAILESGKIVLAVMDICGAMSLKTHYENVVTVHIKKDTRALLRAILEEESSIDDKVGRIVSIEDEKRNEEICDFVLSNEGDVATAERILELLQI